MDLQTPSMFISSHMNIKSLPQKRDSICVIEIGFMSDLWPSFSNKFMPLLAAKSFEKAT